MLLPMLERGVAVHHSGMLPVLREVVEILFQARSHRPTPRGLRHGMAPPPHSGLAVPISRPSLLNSSSACAPFRARIPSKP